MSTATCYLFWQDILQEESGEFQFISFVNPAITDNNMIESGHYIIESLVTKSPLKVIKKSIKVI